MSEENQTMIEFSEDIAQAEAPIPLPAGEYMGTITGAEIAEGTYGKYAKVTIFIAPEQYPIDYDASESPDCVTLFMNRPSLEDNTKSRFQLRQFCEAIGAPMTTHMDLNDWINLEVKIETAINTWEGIDNAQVKKVLAQV